jgi:DNA-binding NarL/FixJ family response regulator
MDTMTVATTGARTGNPVDRLTEREREVLRLIAEGLSDRGIAARLYVSLNTVSTHVQHIFLKLSLPDGRADNRRVLAVLTYMRSHHEYDREIR